MPRDWAGRIAFVLALAIALTLVIGFIVAEIRPGAISEAEINFFSVVAGGAIAEIATYIALRSKHNDRDDHDDSDQED